MQDKTNRTLTALLAEEAPGELGALLGAIAQCCVDISAVIRRGALADAYGSAGDVNVQGETQQKLDVIANQKLCDALSAQPMVAAFASEELDDLQAVSPTGQFLVAFDPLDGSSNIDVNLPTGTIFSILPRTDAPLKDAFLQPGSAQVGAGFVLYGAATQLVFCLSAAVHICTFDPVAQTFICTAQARIQERREFACNSGNAGLWAAPLKNYLQAVQSADNGLYSHRYVGAMVADMHRVLSRGGVFFYPADASRSPEEGKLRLLYEVAPMALLVERAGGRASDGRRRVLDITPDSLHQRCAAFLGSKNEVEKIMRFLS